MQKCTNILGLPKNNCVGNISIDAVMLNYFGRTQVKWNTCKLIQNIIKLYSCEECALYIPHFSPYNYGVVGAILTKRYFNPYPNLLSYY